MNAFSEKPRSIQLCGETQKIDTGHLLTRHPYPNEEKASGNLKIPGEIHLLKTSVSTAKRCTQAQWPVAMHVSDRGARAGAVTSLRVRRAGNHGGARMEMKFMHTPLYYRGTDF